MISIFYNKQALKDSMVICLNDNNVSNIEKHKEYTILKKDNEIIGINIFNVSKKINLPEGYLYPSKEVLDFIYKTTKIKLENNEKKFQICKIIKCEEIKGTHLKDCLVDVGEPQPIKVVCGASNARLDLITVIAKINNFMPNGMFIKKGSLQGKESFGMLCSYKELHLKENENLKGILELPQNSKIGDEYIELYPNK